MPTRQPTSSVHAVGASDAARKSTKAPLRVSVRTSARDASLLVVRPLGAGEALPPGTREAFLVMAEDLATEVSSTRGGAT
jgi:hypothetical protein